MRFFRLKPEVAGGWGDRIVVDRTVSPPRVVRLHYEFDGWLGDDLLTTSPCFIVTDRARALIERLGASGCEFDLVEVSRSGEFMDLYPKRELPRFHWLKVTGTAGKDDLGIAAGLELVVSERVLSVLRECTIQHCEVEPL